MASSITVTFDGNGGGAPSPASVVIPVPALFYGTLATVSRSGYVFIGWYTEASAGYCVTAASALAVDADHTLYAHWREIVTVTLNENGGDARPSPLSIDYTEPGTYGTPLLNAVVARAGYAFAGWYTGAETGSLVTSESEISAWADHTLYARWLLVIHVTLAGNGGGDPEPATLDFSVSGSLYGAGLTGASVTRTGYVLSGWYTLADGGVLVTEDSAVYPWEDHTLYAHWVSATSVDDYWERTEDGGWVYFKANVLAANLPPALKAVYDAWLTAEERAFRLDFLADGIVLDYRGAVEAELHSVGALDPTLIPMPCLRSAQMMAWYFLAIECGYADSASFRQGWQDAEVYLRSLLMATRMGNNRFAEGAGSGGTPRYSLVDDAAGAVSSSSAFYSAPGGPSGGRSPVNYSINYSKGMGL